MTAHPILFSAPMIRALLEGQKTQTRRILKPWPGYQSGWLTADTLHRAPSCYLATVDGHLGAQMAHPLAGTVQPYGRVDENSPLTWVRLPHQPGDRLWVREAFYLDPAVKRPQPVDNVNYVADVPDTEPPLGDALTLERARWIHAQGVKKKPSIHMPRWASRLTLTVADVRVQRLQDISEADAMAEGVTISPDKRPFYRVECPMPNHFDAKFVDADKARSCFRRLWESINGPDAWDANPWVTATSFTVHKCNIDQMEAA